MASRTIICTDAIQWLTNQADHSLDHIVTGIADYDEVSMSFHDYQIFFARVALLCMEKTKKTGYVVFIQTDRKIKGHWYDKSFVLNHLADQIDMKLLWHKIALHRAAGICHLQRPTYCHMMCFSFEGKLGGGRVMSRFPDVLPPSTRLYTNGTPFAAAKHTIQFIKDNTKGHPANICITDIMSGRGTIPAIAGKYGFKSIGIDLDQKACDYAKNLSI